MTRISRARHRRRWSLIAAVAGRALCASIPVFLMKVLCFALFACAFNLLLGYAGLLSLRPRHVLRQRRLHLRPCSRSGACRWSSACSPASLARGGARRWSTGWLAIRRQGIYFAMITLAFAQMVYFICVQAPFTGGEDGMQGIPRGTLFGLTRLDATTTSCITSCWRSSWSASAHLPHRPFAVRPGAEGDPRERAARGLAGLRRRTLQADRLRAVGRASPGLAGATKAMVVAVATLTDVTGRPRARSC